MMTEIDIDTLLLPETIEAVDRMIDCDPLRIALDKELKNASTVASQVKYLQRSRTKLPSYYDARCILPGLSFEQSSSELCARNKSYGGALCIDLTCGLGVDSLYLSKRFEQVISIERDAALARIARINFARLGADNITVINTSAEEFIASFDSHADLIYADPDRRSLSNKKLLLLEECSPNMIELMPRLRELSTLVAIKNSPLFDVDELLKILGRNCSVEVVSLAGECKEVIATTGIGITRPTLTATAIGLGSESFEAENKAEYNDLKSFDPTLYKYLIATDVALRKIRRAVEYMSRYPDIYIESENSYALSVDLPDGVMARSYLIESIEPYNPKELKRKLKDEGIKKIDIMKRNFPQTTSLIAQKLGVQEGGAVKFAFTTIQNRLYAIKLRKI